MSAARLHPADLAALADLVAERVVTRPASPPTRTRLAFGPSAAGRRPESGREGPETLLTTAQVARWLGVKADWVREHASALGARPLGDGPKAQLRFAPEDVRAYLTRRSESGASDTTTELQEPGPTGRSCRPDSGSALDVLPVRSVEPVPISRDRPGGAGTPRPRRRGTCPRRSRSVPLMRGRLGVHALLERRRDMPRKNEGGIYIHQGKRGDSYRFRFYVPGKRRQHETVGKAYGPEAISLREAEARAERIRAQIRLGQYRTKAERIADRAERQMSAVTPYFADFAAEWLERRKVLGGKRSGRAGLSPSSVSDLEWRIGHLNGWFGGLQLSEITEEEVEAFAAAKRGAVIGEGGLGATSMNKVLSTLETILAVAVRYRRIDRNPVDRYRVASEKYLAPHLDTAAQAYALLDAAAVKARARRGRRGHDRALLATLLLGGLRIGEVLALTWRDIDLARGTLRVRDGKTDASVRVVDLLPPLREELTELKARRSPGRDDLVFGTARGTPDSRGNVAKRILAPAVVAANIALEAAEEELVPERLNLHGLRHTYVSVMIALGRDVGYVADQVGHTDAGFTLRRYRKAIRRHDGDLTRWRVLFDGAADDAAAVTLVAA